MEKRRSPLTRAERIAARVGPRTYIGKGSLETWAEDLEVMAGAIRRAQNIKVPVLNWRQGANDYSPGPRPEKDVVVRDRVASELEHVSFLIRELAMHL